jgi:hypothetical protein
MNQKMNSPPYPAEFRADPIECKGENVLFVTEILQKVPPASKVPPVSSLAEAFRAGECFIKKTFEGGTACAVGRVGLGPSRTSGGLRTVTLLGKETLAPKI